MHQVLHAFRRAVDALVRAPFVTTVAVGTIYVAVLLTGALAAAVEAGGRLLTGWSGEVPVTVFLAPGADLEAARAAAAALAPDATVEAIPPAQALRQLRASLGEQGRVLDGLPDDTLPPSVEVRLPGLTQARATALSARLRDIPGAADTLPPSVEVRLPGLTQARATALSARLRDIPGAAEVDDGVVWVARLEALVGRARTLGLLLLAVLVAGTAVLVSNTLRLAVYARRDEIEIMKLVGATDLYVSAPIVLEGILQGLAAGLLAVGTLAGATAVLLPKLRAAFPLVGSLGFADVLPARLVATLLLSAALLGTVASAIALRRFLRRPGG
jgi:cell division transport system permease protein